MRRDPGRSTERVRWARIALTAASAAVCVLTGCATGPTETRRGEDDGVRTAAATTATAEASARPAAATSATAPSAAPPSSARPSDPAASAAAGSPSSPAPTAPGAPPPEPPGDRIYAKARHVWIQKAPGGRGWIGYLAPGGSLRLHQGDREAARTLGPGCDAWYRVEPMGYVCLGPETTLDPEDPVYRTLKEHAGDVGSPFPFEYGESVGTPRYTGIPSEAEQRKAEWDLDAHARRLELAASLRGGATLPASEKKTFDERYLGIDTSPAGRALPELPPIGPLVREARASVARGSTIAWTRAFDVGGRTWLYTSDHAFVPKDRVKPYPRSTFAGVRLEGDVRLPLAFFRKSARPKLRREGERFVETGEQWERLAWVMLTGERVTANGETFLETRESGRWVRQRDAAIAEARGQMPYLDDELPEARRTWLDVSVLGGVLVAYEGRRPVFATLIAPGRGGIPFPGKDPISTASTPTGTFRVDGKFRTATMVSSTDENIVHAEVQYVQNFHGAHALHGAYWHDAWGELKSGGCVNLSPTDSKWLFEWTEPTLPRDWYGLRSVPELGPATRVVVRP